MIFFHPHEGGIVPLGSIAPLVFLDDVAEDLLRRLLVDVLRLPSELFREVVDDVGRLLVGLLRAPLHHPVIPLRQANVPVAAKVLSEDKMLLLTLSLVCHGSILPSIRL